MSNQARPTDDTRGDASQTAAQLNHVTPIGSIDGPISDTELDELCDALLRDWAYGSKSYPALDTR